MNRYSLRDRWQEQAPRPRELHPEWEERLTENHLIRHCCQDRESRHKGTHVWRNGEVVHRKVDLA
jgi:hypothetical protein